MKNINTKTLLTLVFIIALFSCSKLKRKGNEVLNKTEEKITTTKKKIANKRQQFVDKVFPTYDNQKADTESNKKRFIEHLKVGLTNDVKDIYTFGDFMGIDYKVLISFKCDTSTINNIIKAKTMTLSMQENDEGLIFGDTFEWWCKEKIAKIKPYKMGKEYEYWEYLWYDKKTKTAYYEEFSL